MIQRHPRWVTGHPGGSVRLAGVKDLAPGTVLGAWRLEEIVGRGGMGVVYGATDLRLQRPVAIKVIADERAGDPAFRERFEREARLAASIDHPNVIPVYAAGEADGHLYIAMRFVAGTDLERKLRADGPLSPDRAADVVRQVAEALDAAHAAGLVHRDVKPGNVLLAGAHAYLGDFGLTRVMDAADAQQTDTDERMGTVDFMSPEHLRGGRTDARSDVYALGCVLYTLLAGTPPFHRPSAAATVSAQLEDPVPPLPRGRGIPDEFDAVLARALAKAPAERYPSAGDLGRAAVAAARGRVSTDELRSVARGEAAPDATDTLWLGPTTRAVPERAAAPVMPEPTRAIPDRAPPAGAAAPRRRRRRGRRVALAALVFLAAGAAVAAFALWDPSGGDDPHRRLSSAEVADVARAFARAYAREDAGAMRSLLTTDVERVSPVDAQRGRREVLGQYRAQFEANRTRSYRLSGLTATGGNAGRAAAGFTVERAGRPPITGRVVLGVERVDGEPRIRLIATESRT